MLQVFTAGNRKQVRQRRVLLIVNISHQPSPCSKLGANASVDTSCQLSVIYLRTMLNAIMGPFLPSQFLKAGLMPAWLQTLCHCGRCVDLDLLACFCDVHACSSKCLHATSPEAMVAFPSIQTSLLQVVCHTFANVRCRDATVMKTLLSAVRALKRKVLLGASGCILPFRKAGSLPKKLWVASTPTVRGKGPDRWALTVLVPLGLKSIY